MAPLTGFPIRGMKRKLRAIGGNMAEGKRWRRRQWWGLELRVVAGGGRRQAATVTGALIKKADF